MKLNKKIAEFVNSRKQHDSYWVEQAKLDFSITLEKRRRSAKLSYAELANKIGTSAAYISKVFKGDANLTIESMVKLSRATGGKISLNIVDDHVTINPNVWHAHIISFPVASNSSRMETAVTEISIDTVNREPMAA
jgi:transcriptional regulator with XRE-family HTH domain